MTSLRSDPLANVGSRPSTPVTKTKSRPEPQRSNSRNDVPRSERRAGVGSVNGSTDGPELPWISPISNPAEGRGANERDGRPDAPGFPRRQDRRASSLLHLLNREESSVPFFARRGGNTAPSPAGPTRPRGGGDERLCDGRRVRPVLARRGTREAQALGANAGPFKPGTTRLPGTQSDRGWTRSGNP
jgi:hypothetical protein